jgi:peroxiredoxin
VICPECGTQLSEGARFCHQCGWDRKLPAAGKAASTTASRPAWKRRLMTGTLAFFIAVYGYLLLVPDASATPTLKVGQAAPEITLNDLSGNPVSLASLKGRPVVLNFWATWCPPCRREMPEFQQVWEAHKGKDDLVFYALNAGESKLVVDAFMKQQGVQLPVLLDKADQAQNAYKILPIPATFFIDRSGKISAIYETQMTSLQMEAEIDRILAH